MAEEIESQPRKTSDILSLALWIPVILNWLGMLPTLVILAVILIINGFFIIDWIKGKYTSQRIMRFIDLGVFLWNAYLFFKIGVYALQVIAQNPSVLSSPFSF